MLRNHQVAPKANPGRYDFPRPKTVNGRLVDHNGDPVQAVKETDEDGRVTERLDGVCFETDDHDTQDTLEFLRCRAADWADCCGTAVRIMRDAAQPAAPILSTLEMRTIAHLAEQPEPQMQVDIMAEVDVEDRKTIKKVLDGLMAIGFVTKPSPRGGYVLTLDGTRYHDSRLNPP